LLRLLLVIRSSDVLGFTFPYLQLASPLPAPSRAAAIHAAILPSPLEALTAYDQLLETAPILTKGLTSSALFGVSDLIAQTVESTSQPASVGASTPGIASARRTARFMVTGFGSGLIWHHWYAFAQGLTDELTAGIDGASLALARTSLNVALEQFLFIPVYFSLYLLPVMSLQTGKPLSQLPDEVAAQLPGLLWQNAKVWTPANVVIYNLPLQWRCVASNTVDVLWGVICSSMVNQDACDPAQDTCELNEPTACEADACLVVEPDAGASLVPNSGGRSSVRRLSRRLGQHAMLAWPRARRRLAGIGHTVWLVGDTPSVTESRYSTPVQRKL
jgi:hypothetical protein